jgi:3-dehydroquinate dehydratase-1
MICIPIIDKNVDDALKSAENALKVADIVEFRVDMLESVGKKDIEKMAKYPSIITIRANWEGGEYKGDNDKRMELYKTAIENNAKFIDIELKEEKNKKLVEFRNKINSKTKIIVSYHDFEKTPDYTELLEIVKKELEIGDIAKFATMSKSKKDVLNILKIVNEFEGKIIGIGMGEEGKLTRILGVEFGSILTFSSMEGRSSAPGQVDIVKLKKIWELLK